MGGCYSASKTNPYTSPIVNKNLEFKTKTEQKTQRLSVNKKQSRHICNRELEEPIVKVKAVQKPKREKKADEHKKSKNSKASKPIRKENRHKKNVILNEIKDSDIIKENIKKLDKRMNEEEISFIAQSLMKHFFFSNLSDPEM